MSADEMFEKLGFKGKQRGNYIEYVKTDNQ